MLDVAPKPLFPQKTNPTSQKTPKRLNQKEKKHVLWISSCSSRNLVVQWDSFRCKGDSRRHNILCSDWNSLVLFSITMFISKRTVNSIYFKDWEKIQWLGHMSSMHVAWIQFPAPSGLARGPQQCQASSALRPQQHCVLGPCLELPALLAENHWVGPPGLLNTTWECFDTPSGF